MLEKGEQAVVSTVGFYRAGFLWYNASSRLKSMIQAYTGSRIPGEVRRRELEKIVRFRRLSSPHERFPELRDGLCIASRHATASRACRL